MQHLQLLTRPNVDITLVDGDWQAATQGVTDVPEHNAFMYAHVVWYVSLYVGMMDRVDRLTVYVPRYSGICQRAAQIAIELGVPMDVIVADKLECQDVSKHIHELYDEYGIVASPDLAQSYAGYKSAPTPSVLLATRSPYKFVDTVLQALKLPKSVHMHLNLSKLSNYTALAPHEEFVRASSAARRASARKAT
jgi:threonine synthase